LAVAHPNKETVMVRRTIKTNKAPTAIGPYAQGTVAEGLLLTSMQIALDPVSGEIVGATAADQVRRCLENLRAIVEAAGSTLNDVLKTTVYLTDITEFERVNEVYGEFFSEELPSRGVLQVVALPKGALVAVEAIARAQ
jgi:2-iminobutanoate/2-iminopropanoate deaminase